MTKDKKIEDDHSGVVDRCGRGVTLKASISTAIDFRSNSADKIS
jgi:hypothetical protein